MKKAVFALSVLLLVVGLSAAALIRPNTDDSTIKGGNARDQTTKPTILRPEMLDSTPAENQRPRVFHLPHFDDSKDSKDLESDKWTYHTY